MKKILIALIAVSMAATLIGCEAKTADKIIGDSTETSATELDKNADTEEETDVSDENGEKTDNSDGVDETTAGDENDDTNSDTDEVGGAKEFVRFDATPLMPEDDFLVADTYYELTFEDDKLVQITHVVTVEDNITSDDIDLLVSVLSTDEDTVELDGKTVSITYPQWNVDEYSNMTQEEVVADFIANGLPLYGSEPEEDVATGTIEEVPDEEVTAFYTTEATYDDIVVIDAMSTLVDGADVGVDKFVMGFYFNGQELVDSVTVVELSDFIANDQASIDLFVATMETMGETTVNENVVVTKTPAEAFAGLTKDQIVASF